MSASGQSYFAGRPKLTKSESRIQLGGRGIALDLVFNFLANRDRASGSRWSAPPRRSKVAKNPTRFGRGEIVPAPRLAAGHADTHKTRGYRWSAPQRRNNPRRFLQRRIVPALSLMAVRLLMSAQPFSSQAQYQAGWSIQALPDVGSGHATASSAGSQWRASSRQSVPVKEPSALWRRSRLSGACRR
jgi:hypothetical protein